MTMTDKYGKKVKIGDAVAILDNKNGYNFGPSEGVVIEDNIIRLYKCSNPDDPSWNRKSGWHYYIEFKNSQIVKLTKEEYLLSKLKE